MTKNSFKNVVSLILTLVMVFGLIPSSISAKSAELPTGLTSGVTQTQESAEKEKNVPAISTEININQTRRFSEALGSEVNEGITAAPFGRVGANAVQPSINGVFGDELGRYDMPAGAPAVCSDGEYIYIGYWAGAQFFEKYEMDGTFIEEFSIPGVTGIRSITYDGEYFYIGSANTTISICDFEAKTRVGTITSPVNARGLSYAPDTETLWVCDWGTNIVEINLDGTRTGNEVTTANFSSKYGIAYDCYTDPYDPIIWVFAQDYEEQPIVGHYVSDSTETYDWIDITSLTGVAANLAGGLNIYVGEGTAHLLAMVQVDTYNTLFDFFLTDGIVPPETVELTAADVSIAAPVLNVAAQTAVSGTGYRGTIVWSPAVVNRFAGNTVYTANVTLNPKLYFTFASDMDVTVPGQTVEDLVVTETEATFTVTFPETAPAPVYEGEATIVLQVDNMSGDGSGAAMLFDPYYELTEILDGGGTVDLADYTYDLPEGAIDDPLGVFVLNGTAQRVVPAGMYDWLIFNAHWFWGLSVVDTGDNVEFLGGKTYFVDVTPGVVTVTELDYQITSLTATPNEFTPAGGTSEIDVTGAGLNDNILIGAFLNNELVADSWATVYTTGTATQQSAEMVFPENTAQFDAKYTIKASADGGNVWYPLSARVIVKGNFNPEDGAKITLTIGDPWGDGSGYQMLMDPTATANGSSLYAAYQFFIPEDCNINTNSVVWNSSEIAYVPGGVYDLFVANRDGGSFYSAKIFDNYTFEAGHEYEFIVTHYSTITVKIDGVMPVNAVTVPIAKPAGGAAPQDIIAETEAYTGTIEWTPDVEVFDYETVYAADVSLTAKEGFKFFSPVAVTVPGAAAITDIVVTDTTIDFKVTFPATGPNLGSGYARIVLNVGDPFGSGVGVALLLDKDATICAAPDNVAFVDIEYFIPEDFMSSPATIYVVNGAQEIFVPAGIFDWCIGTFQPGYSGLISALGDDYVFASGHTYILNVTAGTPTSGNPFVCDVETDDYLQDVQNAYAVPNEIDAAGGETEFTVTFEGEYLMDSMAYLIDVDGNIVAEVNTTGSATSQVGVVTCTMPANTTKYDIEYCFVYDRDTFKNFDEVYAPVTVHCVTLAGFSGDNGTAGAEFIYGDIPEGMEFDLLYSINEGPFAPLAHEAVVEGSAVDFTFEPFGRTTYDQDIVIKLVHGEVEKEYSFFLPKWIEVTEIKLNKVGMVNLKRGATVQLTVNSVPEGDLADAPNQIVWISSNPAVATVDQNGLVKGLKAGTVTITVKVTTPYDTVLTQFIAVKVTN